MEKEEYKLINWWLSKHGDIYLLHGNNVAENGVPCVNTYELVETSRVLNVSKNRKGFTFKTLNADFLCEINTTIDDRFEWLNDAMLWDLCGSYKEYNLTFHKHCSDGRKDYFKR